MDGAQEAGPIADALHDLGYSWRRVGAAGLKIVDREVGPDADEETIQFLSEMREYFQELADNPPGNDKSEAPVDYGPSEYMVVDQLIQSMDPVGGNLPWVAEQVFEILDDYEAYLKEFKAPKSAMERLRRLNEAVSDLEMKASGRA